MIDTVLLDVDGTLIDSSYHHALAWSRAFAAHDLCPQVWRIHRAIGMGGDKLPAHVAGDDVEERLGDELRDGWTTEYRALVDEIRAFDGAADLIRALRDRGLKVALATSGETEFTEAALEKIGITKDDVDAIVSASDVEDSKPDPDVFAAALAKVGGTAAIVVGDSPWDVESARRMGAPTITVRTGGFDEAELMEAGALFVAESVTDLLGGDWDTWLRDPQEDALLLPPTTVARQSSTSNSF